MRCIAAFPVTSSAFWRFCSIFPYDLLPEDIRSKVQISSRYLFFTKAQVTDKRPVITQKRSSKRGLLSSQDPRSTSRAIERSPLFLQLLRKGLTKQAPLLWWPSYRPFSRWKSFLATIFVCKSYNHFEEITYLRVNRGANFPMIELIYLSLCACI